MRWLWQQGLRWIMPQVTREATKAATDAASSAAKSKSELPSQACRLAVVCPSKRLFHVVADVLEHPKHLSGHDFALCLGQLQGESLLVVRPTAEMPDLSLLLSAIVDGHHPPFVLSTGEGASLSQSVAPGSLVVANHLSSPSGEEMRLEVSMPTVEGVYVGGVVSATTSEGKDSLVAQDSSSEAPLASDRWSWPMAAACQEVGLPLMAVSLVLEPAEHSKEVEVMKQQSSLAGKAGALAGMAWSKRSGLRDLWKNQEAGWEASLRLVALLKQLSKP